MAEMTPVERCQTVFDGSAPDRVPVCLLNFMPAADMTGMSLREYCADGKAMARAHIAAWERYGHDMIDLENGVAALASAVCSCTRPAGHHLRSCPHRRGCPHDRHG